MKFQISELSVIIPTLNEEDIIGQTISALYCQNGEKPKEIIVVDGGSKDDTINRALNLGAKILQVQCGRGNQLAEGAEFATGTWLLFLHADTLLQPGWQKAAQVFINKTSLRKQKVAAFRYKLDDNSMSARLLETIVAVRSKLFGLPWGDQGLLISSSYYRSLGGFKRFPVMEDVEIILRIGISRISILYVSAITSARKYKNSGYFLRSSKNCFYLVCFFCGVPIKWINKHYNQER